MAWCRRLTDLCRAGLAGGAAGGSIAPSPGSRGEDGPEVGGGHPGRGSLLRSAGRRGVARGWDWEPVGGGGMEAEDD